jgi:hypothetical protein
MGWAGWSLCYQKAGPLASMPIHKLQIMRAGFSEKDVYYSSDDKEDRKS